MQISAITVRAVDYMEAHLEDDLDLDTLARELGYSKYHLAHVFAKETGCAPQRYIRERRLTKAAAELRGSRRPVADIAMEAGYGSQQAFTVAFHRLFGCSPALYRSLQLELQGRRRFAALTLCLSQRMEAVAA